LRILSINPFLAELTEKVSFTEALTERIFEVAEEVLRS